jgi:hypothetical protein
MTEKTEHTLNWYEARCSDQWERFSADSVFGSYEALEWSNGGFGGTFAPVAEGVRGIEFSAASLEHAKEICERDYSMRISELLRIEARS